MLDEYGKGRFALFGGPHVFETGDFGLLSNQDNRLFLKNVLRWLLADGPLNLQVEPSAHPVLNTSFFEHGLEIISELNQQNDLQSVAYVEKLLRRTGVLNALDRPQWVP